MIALEELTGRRGRSGFDCGVDTLSFWLRQTALLHQAKGISRTFVATPRSAGIAERFHDRGYVDVATITILGFYALAAAQVVTSDLAPAIARRYHG